MDVSDEDKEVNDDPLSSVTDSIQGGGLHLRLGQGLLRLCHQRAWAPQTPQVQEAFLVPG